MAIFESVLFLIVFLVVVNSLERNVNGNVSSENESLKLIYKEENLGKAHDLSKEKSKKEKLTLKYQSVLERRTKNRDIKNVEEFWKKRTKLADSEVKQVLGNSLPLDENELEANKIILSKKLEEYDKVLDSNETFPPSIHFFQAKQLIDQSEIFEIIKRAPKGANLYGFFLTSIDFEFMHQLTFDDNLYFRFDDKLYLKYSRTKPDPSWRSLSYLRNKTDRPDYVEDLNNAIKESLTMIIANPLERDESASVNKFFAVTEVHISLIKYKPNFMKALRRVLEILYEDNVMYAELHFHFPELYDLDGKTYNPLSTLRLTKVVVDDFIRTHKDFVGIRFICVPDYTINSKNMDKFRETAKELWKANPHLIAGYGIFMGDDALSNLVEELLKFPKEMKFFLITTLQRNWGVNADYNILDALVLSAASIGEASGINKHPFLIDELRKQDIPIKFSPILAQTLRHVKDVRMHPLSLLLATNYPVVIGNAGGSYANATGLSYDWYEAYMAMTPRFCDIRCLKQFAINSWTYSSLPTEEKKRSVLAWQNKWDEFIEDIIIDLEKQKN